MLLPLVAMGAAQSTWIDDAVASGAMTEKEAHIEHVVNCGLQCWRQERAATAAGKGATRKSQDELYSANIGRVAPSDVFSDEVDEEWRAQNEEEKETIKEYLKDAVAEPLKVDVLDVAWSDGTAWQMPIVRASCDMFEEERMAFSKNHLSRADFGCKEVKGSRILKQRAGQVASTIREQVGCSPAHACGLPSLSARVASGDRRCMQLPTPTSSCLACTIPTG